MAKKNKKSLTKVIFLIPGELFSNNFLRSWTKLLLKLPEYGVEPDVRWTIGSNIYKVRNDILMGKNDKGRTQKPFQGKIKYDYLMWIDSDQVFTPDQFNTLFTKMEKDKKNLHILSGVYIKNDNRQYTSVIDINHPDFPRKKAGFILPNDLVDKKKLIKVAFTGMGFMLVRYGVFEKISYPWFKPLRYSYMNDKVVGFASEDASFCRQAQDQGFFTYIDPAVIVGHEKPMVLF